MGSYNNYGVPYYARSDTPAIRPRGIPKTESLPEDWQKNKANKMKALRFMREFIKTNWKTGDKFVFTLGSEHVGLTGTFQSAFLCGSAWMMRLSWDNPKMGKKLVGMCDFYHFAFKPEEVKPEQFELPVRFLVLHEEHKDRYFLLPMDENGELIQEKADKLFLDIFKDRYNRKFYHTKKIKLPVEPQKPAQKAEDWLIEAYEKQLKIYKTSVKKAEEHNEEVDLVEKALNDDGRAAWRLLVLHNRELYEYEGYSIEYLQTEYKPI